MNSNFREVISLVIFTALVIISGGIFIGSAFSDYFIGYQISFLNKYIFAFVLTVIAMGVSFSHIANKSRSVKAASGIFHSWLSREIIFINALLGSSALLIFSNYYPQYYSFILKPLTGFLTILFSILSVLAVGKVYSLESQKTWKGFNNYITPLNSALLLASVSSYYSIGFIFIKFIAFGLFFTDFLLSIAHYRKFYKHYKTPEVFIFPTMVNFTSQLYQIRKIIFIVLLVIFYSDTFYALILAGLMIVTDRFIFYAGAVQILPVKDVAEVRKQKLDDSLK